MFEFQATHTRYGKCLIVAMAIALAAVAGAPHAARAEAPLVDQLEDLVLKGSSQEPAEGFASYYASRFVGKRTTSGQRYNPEKMTAAHSSLPLGTIVRVVNPVTKQEVHVTITDRCAKTAFHFIDLSRAAAKKIGLWGKGKIRVVIIPILEDNRKEPV